MTEEDEHLLLRQYLDTCGRLHNGFGEAVVDAARLMPMDAERIDSLPNDDDATVLVFIKRFEQFEDALHRTLKLLSKLMELNKIERLTARDVTRRAAALGILPDEKTWADAVRARNALPHEYPMDPVKRAEQLNTAWAAAPTLDVTWAAIQRFVRDEGLLP